MRRYAAPILLTLILIGLIAALNMLKPAEQAAEKALEIEMNATPTPSADTRSMQAVTIDPGNTPAPTAVLLRNGVKGDAVRKLQSRLQELGYYDGDADGSFGPATQQAVILFQQQNGLTADGIAGDSTRSALYADDAPTYVPTPEPTVTPAERSLLKKGMKGDDVKQMQEALIALGYLSGKADGQFGGGTEEAVRHFQRQNGLDVDGVAANATLSLLYSENPPVAVVTPTPDPAAMPMLVNRTHPVNESYKPNDLVKLVNVVPSDLLTVKGSDIEGDRTAVQALIAMLEDARDDGITGFQVSAGYRSYKYQQQLLDREIKNYRDQGFSESNARSAARQTVADPGTSEHHTGLAFDLTVAGTTFKGTKQQVWLHKHCWDYGFIIRYQEDKEKITGYLAECWHIRYVGLPHSLNMLDSNKCLEEYLNIPD